MPDTEPEGSDVREEDRYLFDVQGYLVVPGALSPAEVARLNEVFDTRPGTAVEDGRGKRRVGFLESDAALRALIDHERTLPIVEEVCGFGVRLDHYYSIETSKGAPDHELHLGATPHARAASYHVQGGRIYSGLTVVTYALVDHPAGGGGFACIPGSHKASFPCPSDFARFDDGGRVVRHVPLQAGDALIFTEALTHGAFGWRNDHDRRALLFKYSPGHQACAAATWPEALLESCTPRQRALLQRAAVTSGEVPEEVLARRRADVFGATTYVP